MVSGGLRRSDLVGRYERAGYPRWRPRRSFEWH